MAKITRIKAGEHKTAPVSAPEAVERKKPVKVDTSKVKPEKAKKKPFLLFRPFVALGRYLRDSWREIRQVRWPFRKATWKLVFAIFVYTALFVTLIMLLDALFTFIFNKILG